MNANPSLPRDVSAAGRFRLASPQAARWLGVVYLGSLLAAVPLSVLAHQFPLHGTLSLVGLMVLFAAVGVLVAVREPRNPIGWILLALAFFVTLGADAGFYSFAAYRLGRHGLPLARLAVALAPGWIAMIVLLPLPILLFPDGRVPSRRWRWTLGIWAAIAAVALAAVAGEAMQAFTERQIHVDASGNLVSGASSTAWSVIETALFVVYAVLCFSWVIAKLVAFRRATGERRQQLKWLMSGGATCIAGLVVGSAVSPVGYVAVAGLPIGIGVGILKYRLYEIDRLISRTVSYAILTGLLVGVFAGVVVLATDVLPFSSPVGVAASTLAAAALFNPLRRRVQHVVDRRFNRARYDSEAIVAAFTARLQEAVDLDAVSGELLAAVRSIQPAHASVWIRPRG